MMTDICRHTLRHTAITHLVQSGVDLPKLQGYRDTGHYLWALDMPTPMVNIFKQQQIN